MATATVNATKVKPESTTTARQDFRSGLAKAYLVGNRKIKRGLAFGSLKAKREERQAKNFLRRNSLTVTKIASTLASTVVTCGLILGVYFVASILTQWAFAVSTVLGFMVVGAIFYGLFSNYLK